MTVIQPNGRIPDDYWDAATEKIIRLRRPEISATTVWADALTNLIDEGDVDTLARYAQPLPYRGRGAPATKHNARIDKALWNRAQAKMARLRAQYPWADITATSEWLLALRRFIDEDDADTIARYTDRKAPTT